MNTILKHTWAHNANYGNYKTIEVSSQEVQCSDDIQLLKIYENPNPSKQQPNITEVTIYSTESTKDIGLKILSEIASYWNSLLITGVGFGDGEVTMTEITIDLDTKETKTYIRNKSFRNMDSNDILFIGRPVLLNDKIIIDFISHPDISLLRELNIVLKNLISEEEKYILEQNIRLFKIKNINIDDIL